MLWCLAFKAVKIRVHRSKNSDVVDAVNGVNDVTDSVSKLDISSQSNSDTTESAACTCGMQLCICEVASKDDVAHVQPKPVPISEVPKGVDTTSRSRASSSSKPRFDIP